jgi:hypothetical protein
MFEAFTFAYFPFSMMEVKTGGHHNQIVTHGYMNQSMIIFILDIWLFK